MIQGKGNLQTPVDYCSSLFSNAITIEKIFFATTGGPQHHTLYYVVYGHCGDQKR